MAEEWRGKFCPLWRGEDYLHHCMGPACMFWRPFGRRDHVVEDCALVQLALHLEEMSYAITDKIYLG